MVPRRAVALALTGLFAVPALTSCSGSGGLDDSYSVADALSELPPVSTDGFLIIRTADLEAAAELGDLDPDGDDFFQGLLEDPIAVALPPTLTRFEQEVVLGGDVGEIASFVSVQADGGQSLEVFRLPDVDLPDDSDDVDGRARRSDGDRLALAEEPDGVDEWADRDETLADDEGLGALADALDRHDVYSALVNRFRQDDQPTRSFAIGEAVEDGEPVEYVAYVLDEDQDGDEAAEAIEKRWNATATAEDGRLEVDDVEADGDVLVVRIVPDEAGEAARTLELGDFPFPE